MEASVIDVNVAIVANGASSQADDRCISSCLDALLRVTQEGMVVLDDGMLILQEYTRHLRRQGQPGPGDFFMRWVWENQGVSSRCERVVITPVTDDAGTFVEFPSDRRLETFDRSDRKYVAVARASRNHPRILNAVDSDWLEHLRALSENGIIVDNLCPQCLKGTTSLR